MITEDDSTIASIHHWTASGDEEHANARLIAAAPDLLAALRDARALIEDAAIEWPNAMGLTETDATIGGIERSEWMITLDRVLAAIAQATGEAR